MRNILVIDDSLFVLTAVKGILEKNLNDIHVDTVMIPEDAKELLLDRDYQVVLLDIGLPQISGIELLKWVMDNIKQKYIKVIMLSAMDESEILSDCFKYGAYDYVSKPIDQDIFLARINHAFTEIEYMRSRQSYMERIIADKKAVEQLNQELEKAYIDKQKSESLASIGSLAAGMAHEINNPLGFMISNMDILDSNIQTMIKAYSEMKNLAISLDAEESVKQIEAENSVDYLLEDLPELITDILYGSERISNVIKALRTFSNVDRNDKTDIIDILGVIKNIVVMIQGELKEKIEIVFDYEEVPKIVHNTSELSLAIYNILWNAFEAIEKNEDFGKGKIIIRLAHEAEAILLEIEDNGCGMDPETREQALNPFFTTKDVQDGRGLGLTVAKNCFVNGLGGQVSIESKKFMGTKITIQIPIRD